MNPETISLSDFMKNLVLRLGEGIEVPFKDDRPWHEYFYKLKKAPAAEGKPRFLNDLFFEWNGPFPRCPEISECLHLLHWTGSMSAANPTYDRLKLRKDAALKQDNLSPELSRFMERAKEGALREFEAVAR